MSAPCRSVLLTAEALKLKLNLKPISVPNKENMTPEYLKINPHHAIPSLVDNEFALWESRAICIYLVEKYGKNDSLYPKDPKVRGVINQRLYFDMGTLFHRFVECYYAPFYGREITTDNIKKVQDAVEWLDNFLAATGFVAGTKKISVADFSLFATVSTFETVDFDFTPYANVQKWMERMNTLPGADVNKGGVEQIKAYFKK